MSNLTATTREAWEKSVFKEVYMKLILVNKLMSTQRVLKAGLSVKHTVDYEELTSLFQEYGPQETLNGGQKTFMKNVEWYSKFAQVPIEISGRDWQRNSAGGGDGRVIPLVQTTVQKAQRAMVLGLNNVIYRTASSARDSDSNSGFQGITDALTHDIQYGGLTRADSTTNYWWQGASLGNVWTDQATQVAPNIVSVRKCIDAVNHFTKGPSDLIAITSNEIYRQLQTEVDARRQYKPGPMAEHGFTSMMIDDVEIVKEEYFSNPTNADKATHAKYFFLLNLDTWRLHLDPERKLGTISEFVWQGQMQNAKDEFLARIMLSGMITCHNPNQNIFLPNMTY